VCRFKFSGVAELIAIRTDKDKNKRISLPLTASITGFDRTKRTSKQLTHLWAKNTRLSKKMTKKHIAEHQNCNCL
jgi:hypothetical protein